MTSILMENTEDSFDFSEPIHAVECCHGVKAYSDVGVATGISIRDAFDRTALISLSSQACRVARFDQVARDSMLRFARDTPRVLLIGACSPNRLRNGYHSGSGANAKGFHCFDFAFGRWK